MTFRIRRAELGEIAPLRALHREEMDCQIVHDSLHGRGMTHLYAFEVGGELVGYGTVVGFGNEPKETVDELYVRPEHRPSASRLFAAFVRASGATRIQAQTNDRLLTVALHEFAGDVTPDRILFEDGLDTELACPGAVFGPTTEADRAGLSPGRPEEAPGFKLEVEGEIVGTGGVLLHYNPPYGDLHMEVAEAHRRRGYGSFLVQELKRACYAMGRVPAARCDRDNRASRATLQRAGMLPCGWIVTGTIRPGAVEAAL